MLKFANRIPQWFIVFTALTVVVSAVWIPFGELGFKKMGLVEDWTFYQTLDVASYDQIQIQANRPLTPLAWFIGYKLTPDSFVGLNIVSFALMVGKAFLFYLIMRQLLPDNALFAFFTAAIFVIHPADNGIFGLRFINYHAAVFLYLLANYLFLLYWKHRNIFILAAMMVTQLLCLLTLEVGLLLMGITPLMLVWLERKITRKVVIAAVLWYAVPFLVGLWIVSIRDQLLYQLGSLDVSTSGESVLENPIIHHFFRSYERNFFSGWLETDTILGVNYVNFPVIAIVVSVLAGFFAFLFFRATPDSSGKSLIKRYGLLFLAGLIAVPLGYVLFLPSAHRVLNERVFLFSVIGATLSTGAVIYILSRFLPLKRLMFIGMMSLLLGISIYGALKEHNRIINYSITQQYILGGIVENISTPEDNTVVLIFDEYQSFKRDIWTFGLTSTDRHLLSAIHYIYQSSDIEVVVCYPEECQLDGAQIIRQSTYNGKNFPYDGIIALTYDRSELHPIKLLTELPETYIESSPVDYDPSLRIDNTQPLPKRVNTLFTSWPLAEPEYPVVDSFDFEFDQGIGSGWYNPENTTEWTAMWMSQEKAYFNTRLAPIHDYVVEIKLLNAITPEVLNSFALRVNEEIIPLTRVPDETEFIVFTATIPQSALEHEPVRTRIEFQVDELHTPQELGIANDPRSLGLLFDRVTIRPVPKAEIVESFTFEFDQPLENGWYPPENTREWSGMWMSQETAYFETRLASSKSYTMTLEIIHAITPEILDSLVVRINGEMPPLTRVPDDRGFVVLTAPIPQSIIEKDANKTRIEFEVSEVISPEELGMSNDSRPLGLLFNRVSIE